VNSVDSGTLLLSRLENYLKGAYRPIPEGVAIAQIARSLLDWFFAFLRNATICGFLQYIADVSESIPLIILANIAYLALVVYLLSYIHIGVLTPFHFVKHKRLGSVLDGLVTLAVLLSVIYGIFGGMRFSINEIAKGHTASHVGSPRHSEATHGSVLG
jgi:hypothetical protein